MDMLRYSQFINESFIHGDLKSDDVIQVIIPHNNARDILLMGHRSHISLPVKKHIIDTIVNRKDDFGEYTTVDKWLQRGRGKGRTVKASKFIYDSDKLATYFERLLKNDILSVYDTNIGTHKEIIEYALLHVKNKSIEDLTKNLSRGFEYRVDSDGNIKDESDNLDSFVIHTSGVMFIDTKNKTVVAKDRTASIGNRMSSYKGDKDKTYIVINSTSTLNDPVMGSNILKNLMGKFKELKGYTYIDEVRGIEAPVPLAIGLLSTNRRYMDKILNNDTGPIVAYHATSESIWKKIKKDKKMRAGLGPDYHGKIDNHSEKIIYMSLDKNAIMHYGVRAGTARSRAVVLEITIKDVSKITFDEDSMNASTIDDIPEKILPLIVKRYVDAFGGSFDDYIEDYWGLIGDVRENISKGAKNADQRAILSYFANIALKRRNNNSGQSFGYNGTIPLRDIKLVDSFKSKRYDTETYEDDYEEVLKTHKKH